MKKRIIAFILGIAAALAVLAIALGTRTVNSSAETMTEKERYYKSIVIQANDSLWSIAEDYAESTGLGITDYIDEVKTLNGMTSDIIFAGGHLIVFFCES